MIKSVLYTLPMFVCLFWFVFFLIDLGGRSRSRNILCVFMFVAFILYSGHALFFYNEYNSFMDLVYNFCSLAVYPLYLIYILSLTSGKKFNNYYYLFLAPSIMVFISQGITYSVATSEEISSYMSQILYKTAPYSPQSFHLSGKILIYLHHIINILFVLQVIIVIVTGITKISAYNKRIKDFYSSIEGKSLFYVRNVLIFLIITSIFSIVVSLLERSFFSLNLWALAFPSLCFSTLLFIGGYIGYNQRFSMENFEIDESFIREGENPDNQKIILKGKIISTIMKNELFLKKELRISDLAAELGSNRTYISQVINNDLGTTFSDLINTYRIDYAKNLLTNKSDMTMEEVAEMCGFLGKSTFYRVFKKETGITPKKFSQQNLKSA